MVLIMVTSWIPLDKVTEVTEKYMEVIQKFPQESFEKPLVISGSSPSKDGIKVISITEVEKGKYEEAVNLVARRMAEFYSIKGYRFEVETLLTLEEALPVIGMAPP